MRRRKDGWHAPDKKKFWAFYENQCYACGSLLLQTLISLTCDGAGLSPAPGLPEDRP